MKFRQFGPQIYAFKHFTTLHLSTQECHGWDRKEGCGTGSGSCGDMGTGKFGNSKEMDRVLQHCRGLRDGSLSEGGCGFYSDWHLTLIHVKHWWAVRLVRRSEILSPVLFHCLEGDNLCIRSHIYVEAKVPPLANLCLTSVYKNGLSRGGVGNVAKEDIRDLGAPSCRAF